MPEIFSIAMVLWVSCLSIMLLFEKSRADALEKCMGSMCEFVCAEEEQENDWK